MKTENKLYETENKLYEAKNDINKKSKYVDELEKIQQVFNYKNT